MYVKGTLYRWLSSLKLGGILCLLINGRRKETSITTTNSFSHHLLTLNVACSHVSCSIKNKCGIGWSKNKPLGNLFKKQLLFSWPFVVNNFPRWPNHGPTFKWHVSFYLWTIIILLHCFLALYILFKYFKSCIDCLFYGWMHSRMAQKWQKL